MSRILIADDHAVVRRGLREILTDELGPTDFGEAETAAEALAMLKQEDWDAMILDIALPDKNGMQVLREARKANRKLPILVLSMYPEDQYALRMLRAGAVGYMTKETAPEELGRAARKILAGGRYVSETLAEKLAFSVGKSIGEAPHLCLSNREYQVLCMIASGKSLSEVAADLSLSIKTVSTFRSRVLKKMNLKNNAQIMSYALRNHLVK